MGIIKGLVLAFLYFVGVFITMGIEPTETVNLLFLTIPIGLTKGFTVGFLLGIIGDQIPWGI